jgi:NAD(P)-dependent dehydrogenase (short-subunit alcohol dehydrogenase family)
MRFSDKIGLVTGGLSGIGAAIAEALAREGAMVIAADISAPPEATLAGGGVLPFRVDVTDPASVAALIAAAKARFGRIDYLVTSAGIGRDLPFLETPLAEFERMLAVNLRGTFLAAQATAREMLRTGGGAIVTIGSVSGQRGNIGRAAYGASKGGVAALSQVMAVELAAANIRVNCLAPGPVETPLVAEMHDPAIRAAWSRVTPMHRYAAPDEIAAAACFLLSDAASFITGHVLAADGGFLAGGLIGR